jgi:hypothetical protein
VVVNEQQGVSLGVDEAKRQQVGGEADVPSTGGLFEVVERLVEAANEVRV